MTSLQDSRTKIATARLALLFCVFFLIACGLGYPILNRFDPRQTPGLSDVKIYASLVTGTASPDAGHVRYRVLVPWLAKPFYRLAQGRFATWDPVMFGLLVADSLFVAGTAVLIVILGVVLGNGLGSLQMGSSAVGLVGALLYLVNFAVPNLRLVGLVDAGEGFFLLALLWSLSEFELWALPVIAVLGALTKESFIPFSIVLTSAWFSVRPDRNDDHRNDGRCSEDGNRARNHYWPDAAWILTSWVLSPATMIGLQWSITGRFASPLQFGLALHRGDDYLSHFASSLHDRNLWYIFLWLLPTAIPNLRRLPKAWLIPVGATCAGAFVLDAYFGGAPGTVGRALFSIAGPMLSLSSALLLLRIST
jgi:hypothetical protein